MIRDRLAQSAPGGKEVFRATAALKENRDLRVSKGFLVRPALKDSKEIAAVPDHRENRAPSVRQDPRVSGVKPALRVNLALRDLRARHLPSLWELSPPVLPQPSPPIRQTPGSPWTLWFPLAPRGRKVNLVKLDPKDRRASLGRLLKLQWSKIHLLSTRFGLKLRRQIS